MSGYKQLSLDEVSVARIRSHFNTVRKCVVTSMQLKGRIVPAVHAKARLSLAFIEGQEKQWPDSERVRKWVEKYKVFCGQHGLFIDGSDGSNGTEKRAETESVQPDPRQDKGSSGTGGSESDVGRSLTG